MPVNNKLLLWRVSQASWERKDYEDTALRRSIPGTGTTSFPSPTPPAHLRYGDLATTPALPEAQAKPDFLVFNENFTASYVTGPHSFNSATPRSIIKESRDAQFAITDTSSFPAPPQPGLARRRQSIPERLPQRR